MPGQGKGKHIGRKNKYLRNKSKSEKNAILRRERHTNRVIKQSYASEENIRLLGEVLTKNKLKKATLKKMIGTLNTKRLKSVLLGTHEIEKWFILRTERRRVIKHVRPNRPKNEGVPEGRNTPDGNS